MTTKPYLFALLLALLALPAGARQTRPDARTLAVVIGISKYQKLPGGQQLQFADRDAASFAEAIQKKGVAAQDVKLLTGSEATGSAIKSAIGNWLARSASESDTVLIFFSGHGLFEREFGEAYLLAYDSDPKDPYGTALSVSELSQALSRRVRSSRVLVIADAVRRDFFDPETDANSAAVFEHAFDQLAASRPGLSAIVASGAGEFSREGQRWGGRGVFTKHLADVLFDGAARNGNIAATFGELFDLLKARVSEDTAGKQHPWRTGSVAQTEVAGLARQPIPAPVAPKSEPIAKNAPNPGGQSEPPGEYKSQPNLGPKKDGAVVSPVTLGQSPKQPSVEKSGVNDKKAGPAPPAGSPTKKDPGPAESSDKKSQSTPVVAAERKANTDLIEAKEKKQESPPVVASANKTEPGAETAVAKKTEVTLPVSNASAPSAVVAPKPSPTGNPGSKSAPIKSPALRAPTPPVTETNDGKRPPIDSSIDPSVRPDISLPDIPPPPRPTISLPNTGAVASERAANKSETIATSVPTARPDAAPTPLILQLETAIASRNLVEPRNASAWDFYQQLASDPAAAADAARLKPVLSAALAVQGRAIVNGDVRADNISDKVDEFKRAGQMLARARTLTPENGEVSALEKLSAAEALIALQFYDEAERALAQLQTAKLAAVENALGLVYHGRLDTFRAERAFKRAIEIDAKWAAPHYNLALLYRSQQNQASLAELEAAASLDSSNVNLMGALGDEYFSRQQWKEAAETFRKAVALKPSDDNLHTKLGHALYSQGQQDEANREYQKARELRGKRP